MWGKKKLTESSTLKPISNSTVCRGEREGVANITRTPLSQSVEQRGYKKRRGRGIDAVKTWLSLSSNT